MINQVCIFERALWESGAGEGGLFHAKTMGTLQVCNITMIKFVSADTNVDTCVSFVNYLPPNECYRKSI